MRVPYEAPSVDVIGSLHDLTMQIDKRTTGVDGTVLQPGNIPLGSA